jgi:hypothetical protein
MGVLAYLDSMLEQLLCTAMLDSSRRSAGEVVRSKWPNTQLQTRGRSLSSGAGLGAPWSSRPFGPFLATVAWI